MDPWQGCGHHHDWLPRQRRGSSLSAAGWLGRLQTARYDDWDWENLSMERRGLWATAARNLAVSLFHDIMPAGRGRAAPRMGRAVQGCMELVQAEGSAFSSPAEPQPWRLSKENPPPEGQVHPDTRPFGSQAPSVTVRQPKTLHTSPIFTSRGTSHAGSPSWGSPCWWHHAGPQPCCCDITVPQAEMGARGGVENPQFAFCVHLQCSKTGKSQQEISSSTDQDHVHIGYGLRDHATGTQLGTGIQGEGIPHLECFPGQCRRSHSSICWLPGQGCRGWRGGKVLGKRESW